MAVIGVTAASGPSVSVILDGSADRQVFVEASVTSTLTQVAQNAASVSLLTANGNRTGGCSKVKILRLKRLSQLYRE